MYIDLVSNKYAMGKRTMAMPGATRKEEKKVRVFVLTTREINLIGK